MDLRLECRDVAHRFAPGRGLDPVSFALAGPRLAAVTGPNGSGKSTLLRILAGLLHPGRGAVELEVAGRTASHADRRLLTGWCAPDLHFYGELTVEENLRFAAETRGVARFAEAAREAAHEVGLEGRLADRAAALSSGLRQRMRLAFAILDRPPVLLLDEPGSHLDEPGLQSFFALLDRLRKSALILVATNDSREWSLADERITLGPRGLGHPA